MTTRVEKVAEDVAFTALQRPARTCVHCRKVHESADGTEPCRRCEAPI